MIGLILAAGNSSRLGQPKQLVQFHGKSLLENTIDALSTVDELLVVLGADAESFRSTIGKKAQIIENKKWQLGMGSSIKNGISHIMNELPSCEGILISVCDQPFLDQSHIVRMTMAFCQDKDSIVASQYRSEIGVPVLFPRSCFDELLTIGDTMGARDIIKKLPNKIVEVPFEKGSIDIDTPEDLSKLERA